MFAAIVYVQVSGCAWRHLPPCTYSANGGQCVECAPGDAVRTGVVPVCDSKNPGPTLITSTNAWQAFVEHVKG